MALTFTLDQLVIDQVILTRNGTDDVKVMVFYSLKDVTETFALTGRKSHPTPTAQQQTQLKNMWDGMLNFIRNNEGLP